MESFYGGPNIVQEVVTNTISKKEMLEGKMVSEEALQMAEKGRKVKGKGKRERYAHLDECRIPENIMDS